MKKESQILKMNDRIFEIALGDHGFISFRARPGHKYKWAMHETPAWFEKAKMVQGKDWLWNNCDSDINYIFNSHGFREEKEIEEVSEQKEWWLFDNGCLGLGVGVHQHDTAPRIIEDLTGIDCYNMSLYGDRPEFSLNNLCQIAKRWTNPPTRIFLSLVENPTGTFKMTPTDSIRNIDYFGSIVREKDPEYSFFREFENNRISESHHKLFYNILLNLTEYMNIPVTWIHNGDPTDISPINYMDKEDVLIYRCVGGSMGYHTGSTYQPKGYHSKDSFEDRQAMAKHYLNAIKGSKHSNAGSQNDYGRDLMHPCAKSHEDFSRKLVEHLDLNWW